MTGADHTARAIEACRRTGLPVVEADDCTCGLHGRLVVLAGPSGLRVIWPYDRPCPIHGRHDRERRRQPRQAGPVGLGQRPCERCRRRRRARPE